MVTKARLKATGKTRQDAVIKLVIAMNHYPTHKFSIDNIIESKDGEIFILEIEGEVL